MGKPRLLWHLYPSYLLVTLLALAAMTWNAWGEIRQTYLAQTRKNLLAQAYLSERLILPALHDGDIAAMTAFCREAGRSTGIRFTVILVSGRVLADSSEDPAVMENHRIRPEVLQALATGVGVAQRHSHTLNADMMYLAIPLHRDGAAVAVMRTALPLTHIRHALQQLAARLYLGIGLTLVALAAVSLFISRRISRPLEEMRRSADHFARGRLDTRLPAQDTAEMAALADALNGMAAQLDARIRTAVRQRNEQEAMLLSMAEGILAVDNDERILKLNQAAGALLGVNPDTAQRRSIQEVVRNSDLQAFVARALAGDEAVESEILMGAHRERYMQLHGTVLADEEGRRIGALVVLNDVTRLRKLETVRRDFVANVSHELKTPITSIKGFVETLLDGQNLAPQDVRRFLEIIARHTDRLNAIIEDLLSLSRLEQQAESGALPLEEVALCRVLTAAAQNCAYPAQEQEIRLQLECDGTLHAPLNAPLLEQAVTNLIDNAVKYSDPGSKIAISALRSSGEIVIRVQDQGCGIAPEHLPRLFERFYRADAGRSRKLGGTGLGLSIVKHIAQAHHGRVTVESTPGHGSTFTLYLPASADVAART